MRHKRSIEPAYFENLYQQQTDPWDFETSVYERNKYNHTLESLPRARYAEGLEIGCSIGVLTRKLADRCDGLLAIDVSQTALAKAASRCADAQHVTFATKVMPKDRIEGVFDLIVLSEVAYYWDAPDLARVAANLRDALRPGGDVLLVHYTKETNYPLSGDDAVTGLHKHLERDIAILKTEVRQSYRLDVWRRLR